VFVTLYYKEMPSISLHFPRRLSKQLFLVFSLLLSLLLAFVLGAPSPATIRPAHSEILWDTWGVPHISGKDTEGLFRAFGWAQMQSHGDLILRLYGSARGRGAEYWGNSYINSDRLIRTMGFPNRAHEWYAAQSSNFQRYLEAFAAGINAYAEEHGDQIADEVKVVLPVDANDVLAHAQSLFFNFLAAQGGCGQAINLQSLPAPGSNGWAIAPIHSASSKSMLLTNPHLYWSGEQTLYEAQLTAPGIDAYGAALVGLPALAIAFNDYQGWTHTNNPLDGCDLYALSLADGGYRFDGQVYPFQTEVQTLKVKQDDGSLSEEQLVVRRSIQGPVVQQNGQTTATAIRVVGVDQFPVYGLLEQEWDMARAKNLSEFEAALKKLQLPFFNVIYADRDGHIMYLFNGQEPVRSQGDYAFWQGIVPGDTSATLWSNILSYNDLPKITDPANGWVQNSNDSPWTATFPEKLNPNDFPPYIAPRGPLSLRPQRGIYMLTEEDHISFRKMIEDKYSTFMELADRILDDLISAARQNGSETASQAADVLQAWDRQADADSRGALLFGFWANEVNASGGASNFFLTPWEENAPLTTPKGIANPGSAVAALERAASKVQSAYGALDVPWGQVMRLQRGNINLPGNGGPGDELGIFRVIDFLPTTNGQFQSYFGDSYIAAVEFSNPVRARVLNTYGNSTQPGSPHLGDQLVLSARKELRPAWRSRPEIEAHLESRQVF